MSRAVSSAARVLRALKALKGHTVTGLSNTELAQLTQAGAAEQCGVSREIWGRYERGLAVPGGEVLFSFANAGADVQYILTGVRSSVSSVEEHLVLERFRSSPQNLKDAALRVLLGEPSGEETKQTFKEVGQYIHGAVNQSGVTFNVGGSKGKK